MAGEPFIGSGNAKALGGLYFLAGATNAMDVYSAVNSSPWTAETVTGGDATKEASLKRYCTHAICQTVVLNGLAGIMAGPKLAFYPIFGATIETVYMTWLYWDAVKRGRASKQGPFGVAAA